MRITAITVDWYPMRYLIFARCWSFLLSSHFSVGMCTYALHAYFLRWPTFGLGFCFWSTILFRFLSFRKIIRTSYGVLQFRASVGSILRKSFADLTASGHIFSGKFPLILSVLPISLITPPDHSAPALGSFVYGGVRSMIMGGFLVQHHVSNWTCSVRSPSRRIYFHLQP